MQSIKVKALQRGIHPCWIRFQIVGDGGCFHFVVDIAVLPELQGRGLGKRIMGALDAWLRANAEPTAHVSLFADGQAKHLYAQYGFAESSHSVGMFYRV